MTSSVRYLGDLQVQLLPSLAEVTNIMAKKPGRIAKIKVLLRLPDSNVEKDLMGFKNTAKTYKTCQSLLPAFQKDSVLLWGV